MYNSEMEHIDKPQEKTRRDTPESLAAEARNNDIRCSECKCPNSFAHLLEAWTSKNEKRSYEGEWHNYNGIDVFSVKLTGTFGTFRKNYYKTKFVRVNVNGERKTLEIPEDPAFYKYAHRIMADVEEHDLVIKQFTDGRMKSDRVPHIVAKFTKDTPTFD